MCLLQSTGNHCQRLVTTMHTKKWMQLSVGVRVLKAVVSTTSRCGKRIRSYTFGSAALANTIWELKKKSAFVCNDYTTGLFWKEEWNAHPLKIVRRIQRVKAEESSANAPIAVELNKFTELHCNEEDRDFEVMTGICACIVYIYALFENFRFAFARRTASGRSAAPIAKGGTATNRQSRNSLIVVAWRSSADRVKVEKVSLSERQFLHFDWDFLTRLKYKA